MELSIIIPTKLAHNHIFDCIQGIKKCTKGVKFEILIIVNQDSIIIPEVEKKLKNISEDNIRIFWPGKDLGIAGAINLGIKNAKGEYTLVTNDDIKLKTKDWFLKYKKLFNKLPHTGTIGFAGNNLGFGGYKIGHGKNPTRVAQFKNFIHAIRECYNYPPSDETEVFFNHTCSTFTKKDVFEKINGYDEIFWPYGGEDTDLGLRLLIHGYRNYKIPLKHLHYGDKLGVSKHGGATHNLVRERDVVKKNAHNVDVLDKNRIEFEKICGKKIDFERKNIDSDITKKSKLNKKQNESERNDDSTEISIIIRVKNEEKNIGKCLDAIFNQKTDKKFEVIILYDNTTTDNTLNIIKKYPVQIYIVQNYIKDFHRAKAFNLGVKKAKGDIIVSISSDAIPIGNYWLKNLIKPMKGEIIACSGKMMPRESSNPMEKRRIISSFHDNKIENTHLTFVNSAIKKEILEKFPIREDILCSEDKDLLTRLKLAGMKIIYNPESQVIHSHDPNFSQHFQLGLRRGQSYNEQNILKPKLKYNRDLFYYSLILFPRLFKQQISKTKKNYIFFKNTKQNIKWYFISWPYEFSFLLGFYLGPIKYKYKK